MRLKHLMNFIKKSKSIVIFPHEFPDMDCISSACSLAQVLQSLGKTVQIVDADPVPDECLKYVFWANRITNEIKDPLYDLIIVLDTADIAKMDHKSYTKYLKNTKVPIINIDHHVTNSNFGSLNIVDNKASSTSELLFRIFDKLGFDIPKVVAFNLLLGLVFDTKFFTVPSTNMGSFHTAEKLIELGADLQEAHSAYYQPLSIDEAYIRANIMQTMQTVDNKIAYVSLTLDPEKSFSEKNVLRNLKPYISSLIGVEIAVIFQEERTPQGNSIKISLRSKSIDLTPIVMRHDGGGHRNACGCIIQNMPLTDAENMIIGECKSLLHH